MNKTEVCDLRPYKMGLQTLYHGKEKYNDIIESFRLEDQQEIAEGTSGGQRLMTIIDTMDNMSVEIYEQYRYLQDLFKKQWREVRSQLEQQKARQTAEPQTISGEMLEEILRISCSVMKACGRNVISREKYAKTGMDLFDHFIEHVEEAFVAEHYDLVMKALEQRLILLRT